MVVPFEGAILMFESDIPLAPIAFDPLKLMFPPVKVMSLVVPLELPPKTES